MATIDCSFCGDKPAAVMCKTPGCSRNILCEDCDQIWHGHPNRRNHVTEAYKPESVAAPLQTPPVPAQQPQQHDRPPPQRPAPPQPKSSPTASSGSQWQCQHCTFINDAPAVYSKTRKICAICGKSDGVPPIEDNQVNTRAGGSSVVATGVAKPASYSSAAALNVTPDQMEGSSGIFDSREPAHVRPGNTSASFGTNNSGQASFSNKNAYQNSIIDVNESKQQCDVNLRDQGQKNKANDFYEQQRQALNLQHQKQKEQQKALNQKEQLEREKQQREKLEREKQEREHQEQEKQRREQLEREKQQREHQEREKQRREQLEREKQQREHQEREKQRREQIEREKQQREHQEREKQRREQMEREKQQREHQEREKQERAKQERREKEKQERPEKENQGREKQQKDQDYKLTQSGQKEVEQQNCKSESVSSHNFSEPINGASARQLVNNPRDGSWVCQHCTLRNPAPSQLGTKRGVCVACTYTTELNGEKERELAKVPSEAVDSASMMQSAAIAAACDAVDEACAEAELRHHQWPEEVRKLAVKLKVEGWVAERTLAVKSMPNFRKFSDVDLSVAIESCGHLAYEDEALLRQLRRECSRCSQNFPRHNLVFMVACECQMCPECFKNFLLSLQGNQIKCPVCKTEFDDEDSRELMRMQLMEMADALGADTVQFAVSHLETPSASGNLSTRSDGDWQVVSKSKQKQKPPSSKGIAPGYFCPHRKNGLPDTKTRMPQAYCKDCNRHVCKQCFGFWDDHQRMDCGSYQRHVEGNRQKGSSSNSVLTNLPSQMMKLLTSELLCPKCDLSYQQVTKSGCPVLHCSCKHSFCPFCLVPAVGRHNVCRIAGVHVHHHRQCYFSLKHGNIKQTNLLELLKRKKVRYNEESTKNGKFCELPDLRVSERGRIYVAPCNEIVTHNKPGVCDRHYREYLIQLINANGLDLVDVAKEKELQDMFERFGLFLPEVKASAARAVCKEKLEIYRNKLKELVPPIGHVKVKETRV